MPEPKILAVRLSGDEIHARMFKATVYEIFRLGDLNDFQFSPPVETLQGDVLTNLMQVLPPQEQYSYVFEGNSQVLDQMLVSANLFIPASIEYDVVHINAEFATQVSRHYWV
jgi:predicted extracellular nuclease